MSLITVIVVHVVIIVNSGTYLRNLTNDRQLNLKQIDARDLLRSDRDVHVLWKPLDTRYTRVCWKSASVRHETPSVSRSSVFLLAKEGHSVDRTALGTRGSTEWPAAPGSHRKVYTTAVTTYITPLITPEKVQWLHSNLWLYRNNPIYVSVRRMECRERSSRRKSCISGERVGVSRGCLYARNFSYAAISIRTTIYMCVHTRVGAYVWVLRCVLAAGMCVWVELDPGCHPSDRDGLTRLGGSLIELASFLLSFLSLAPFISPDNVQWPKSFA